MKEKRWFTRLLTLLLSVSLICSMLTVFAFAENDARGDTASVSDIYDEKTLNIDEETPNSIDEPNDSVEPAKSDEEAAKISEEPADSDEEASDEPEVKEYTVTFYAPDGKTLIKQFKAKPDSQLDVKDIPVLTESGLKIGSWLQADGKKADFSKAISADTEYKAKYLFGLNNADHKAYIAGYKDYTFRPDNNMSRAEAAQMLSRLLILQGTPDATPKFSDVGNQWFADAVGKLSSLGIIQGYKDGTFRPNGKITRAEFVAMLCRFYEIEPSKNDFKDVPKGAWYEDVVTAASSNGWILGYKDGTFRPNNQVTRGEAVTIINRILGRSVDENLWKNVFSSRQCFVDVAPSEWCAAAITEASVNHKYSIDGNKEIWSGYTAPSGLNSGVRAVCGGLSIVDENGLFVIQNAGLAEHSGKHYHVSKKGVVMDNAPKGTVRYNDGLFCGDGSGAVMINADYEVFHFGANGKYTSGNKALDTLVDELIAKATTRNMSKDDMLRAVYVYLRDSGEYSYLNGSHQGRGTTDWAESAALSFLQDHKGNCYGWAGTFTYLARALGFNARVVSGGVPRNNSDHAWTMIMYLDGNEYLFDVELEWGYKHGKYDNNRIVNLYKVTPSKAPVTYYFP